MTISTIDALARRLDEAEAMEAVSILKARYFRLMDEKRWDEWEHLFAEDAVMDMRGEAAAMQQLGMDVGNADAWLLTSRAAIRGAVEMALDGVVTVHHGHMPEMKIGSPREITAVWAMTDVIRYPVGRPIGGFTGYGHYHDTYALVGESWKIKNIVLRRIAVTPVHR